MPFIYVKIPLQGRARALSDALLHERLELALGERRAGTLLGWGASMELGSPGDDAALRPAFHRIDIEATDDPRHARAVLRESLAALEVPAGTELHYTQGGASVQELFQGAAGWSAPQPSSGVSPPRRRH